MKLIAIILLFPFVSYGQVFTSKMALGEYTQINLTNGGNLFSFSANPNLVGIAGATFGIPKQITGTGTTFAFVGQTLHGGNAIDVTGSPWGWGNNTDGELGFGSALGTYNITKITADSRGVPFTNITITQGSYFQQGSNDVAGNFWVKDISATDTVFYAGLDAFGMGGDGSTGSTTYLTPQLMFPAPSGHHIVQMFAADAAGYRTDDGRVFTWGAGGAVGWLGRAVSGSNYATPIQVTIPGGDSIMQVVGGGDPGILYLGKSGKLYGNTNYSAYMGDVSNVAYNSPTDLTTNITSHILNGTTITSIIAIAANSVGFYVICNDGTLWFWGDTGMGTGGTGNEANMLTPGGTSTPWFIDPSTHLVVQVYTPIQVTNKTNWTKVFSGCLFQFSMAAMDVNNQLWMWGRNKGGVIPNAVIECPGDGGALTDSLPNSWDVTDATPVNPYTISSTIGQGNLGCASGLITAGCFFNCRTIRTPVAVATSTNGVLNATGSSTPSPNSIVRYRWSQISGPNTALIPARASPIDTLGNLIPGTYTFGLQVMDNGYDSATTTTTLVVGQTGFYVSSSTGSDGNAGTSASPFATRAKANSVAVAGDTVYLKAGDTFNGTWYFSSGTSGSPIVWTSYGAGAPPLVTGFSTLSGGTNEGGGIFGFLNANLKATTNLVTIGGVLAHMAIYPNSGYWPVTAATSSNATTNIPNGTNVNNTTAVFKDERFCIDTLHVTSQSTGVIGFASAPTFTNLNGRGIRFENSKAFLDTALEFYVNPATDTIYLFGSSGQVTISDTGAYLAHVNYVTIKGIDITGFNQWNALINADTGIVISNCGIRYSGNDGVTANQCVRCSFISDTIQYSNNNGMTVTGSNTTHMLIQSCQVAYNGLNPGMGKSGGGGTYQGINQPFSFSTFTLNNIDSNGSSGLVCGGDSLNVFNNHIHHDGFVKSDGGEIYTHDGSLQSYTYPRNINGNICDHSFNDTAGVNYQISDVNFGMYADADASGLFVFNNTFSFNASSGIFNHGPSNSYTSNNLFGNFYFQTNIAEVSPFTITGTIYKHNTHGFSTSTPNSIILSSTGNDLSSFGTIDSNYYLAPIGLSSTFFTKSSVDGGTVRTLASWTSNTTYDSHSLYLNSILLFQSSVTGGTFSLGGAYKSATGTIYNGSLTLSPYSSLTLLPISISLPIPRGVRVFILP